jgi:hypothetical protein
MVRNYPLYRAFNGRAAPKIVIVLHNQLVEERIWALASTKYVDRAILGIQTNVYYVLYALRDL